MPRVPYAADEDLPTDYPYSTIAARDSTATHGRLVELTGNGADVREQPRARGDTRLRQRVDVDTVGADTTGG